MRGRQKGCAKPEGSGKQKGTPNKTSRTLIAQLDELGMEQSLDHPVVWMFKVAHGIIPLQRAVEDQILSISATPELRVACMKEVAKYVSPQLKAIDHTGGIDITAKVTYLDNQDKDI